MNAKPLLATALWLALPLADLRADNPSAAEPPGGEPGARLLPQPAKLEAHAGAFRMNAQTAVVAPAALTDEARMLAAELRAATGFSFPLREHGETNAIRLTLDSTLSRLAPEGYRLRVGAHAVELAAPAGAGIFYAGRTLLQLAIPAVGEASAAIAGVAIEDQPRFGWRGLMLDCSRTFQSLAYLHQTIDRLAAYKMNVLHLHLTDEQGWRMEIKKYPVLTQKGARFAPAYHEPEAHQGLYSQEQLRELIAYAAQRQVTIVPEIEMPSHCVAATVCRPDLVCPGPVLDEIVPYTLMASKLSKDRSNYPVFCAGNDDTFAFLEDVLDEVIAVFPSKFIHIGGDEAPKIRWKNCPKCQARIQAEGLKNEHELQSYFVRRIERHLNAKGRQLIGWSEILEGGLAPNAAVMDWIGGAGPATKAGHDVVMSPTSHCYFDYTYGTISSERAYHFDPVAALPPEQARHVLGLQANFWSHLDREPELVDRQLFPRLLALAERGWSPDPRDDWEAYARRARAQLPCLARLGIRYQTTDLPVPAPPGL